MSMMEETAILTGSDGTTIEGSIFAPPKRIRAQVDEFEVLESQPSDSVHETIQLAIRHPSIAGDLLRVDSYKAGYFSSYWLSDIDPGTFLRLSEAYFTELEGRFTAESELTLTLCASWLDPPELYAISRPLTLRDFKDVDRAIDDPVKGFSVVRLDTPAGDVCYEPQEKRLGLIAEPDDALVIAAAKLVNSTQPLITEEAVRRTLSLLPYPKSS